MGRIARTGTIGDTRPMGRVVFILLWLAAAPMAAGAELRLMTTDINEATSTCLGQPVSPLCAAETAAACAIVGRKSLCDAVDRKFHWLFAGLRTGYVALWQNRYEYLGEQTLRADDIPEWARPPNSPAWLPGDVALRLWWQGCPPIEKCVIETRNDPNRAYGEGCRTFTTCQRERYPETYILRKRGDRWIFVETYVKPVLPDTFWQRQ